MRIKLKSGLYRYDGAKVIRSYVGEIEGQVRDGRCSVKWVKATEVGPKIG